MGETLFSWQTLITLGGASMLTFLIVLYTNRLIANWWKLGTDLYAVLWGWIILIMANLAAGASGHDWRTYALTFCNSFLVAAAAGKLRDKSISEKEKIDSMNIAA